ASSARARQRDIVRPIGALGTRAIERRPSRLVVACDAMRARSRGDFMARHFFDKPQRGLTPVGGTVITDVQLALNDAGAGNLVTDGLYGGHTADALETFQRSKGIPV